MGQDSVQTTLQQKIYSHGRKKTIKKAMGILHTYRAVHFNSILYYQAPAKRQYEQTFPLMQCAKIS